MYQSVNASKTSLGLGNIVAPIARASNKNRLIHVLFWNIISTKNFSLPLWLIFNFAKLRAESNAYKERLDAEAKELIQWKQRVEELEEKERVANENVGSTSVYWLYQPSETTNFFIISFFFVMVYNTFLLCP